MEYKKEGPVKLIDAGKAEKVVRVTPEKVISVEEALFIAQTGTFQFCKDGEKCNK